jgi:hypothetical protein
MDEQTGVVEDEVPQALGLELLDAGDHNLA